MIYIHASSTTKFFRGLDLSLNLSHPKVFNHGTAGVTSGKGQTTTEQDTFIWIFALTCSDGGKVVSIAAFQAVDLGSIPFNSFIVTFVFIFMLLSKTIYKRWMGFFGSTGVRTLDLLQVRQTCRACVITATLQNH